MFILFLHSVPLLFFFACTSAVFISFCKVGSRRTVRSSVSTCRARACCRRRRRRSRPPTCNCNTYLYLLRQVPRPACSLTSAQWEIYRVTSRHLDLSFAILSCILYFIHFTTSFYDSVEIRFFDSYDHRYYKLHSYL